MLKVTDIAITLEISTRQVYTHIKRGRLNATVKNGEYVISQVDFDDFYKSYWVHRHKSKGSRTPNKNDLHLLKKFIEDINCNDLNYENFIKKYKYIINELPPMENFLLLKRNEMILLDISNGLKQKTAADKYQLSQKSIETIVKKSKEGGETY